MAVTVKIKTGARKPSPPKIKSGARKPRPPKIKKG